MKRLFPLLLTLGLAFGSLSAFADDFSFEIMQGNGPAHGESPTEDSRLIDTNMYFRVKFGEDKFFVSYRQMVYIKSWLEDDSRTEDFEAKTYRSPEDFFSETYVLKKERIDTVNGVSRYAANGRVADDSN